MSLNPKIENSQKIVTMSEFEEPEQTVSLRTLCIENIESFMEWATDKDVTQYMMWDAYTSQKEAENFFINIIEKHPWFKAICLGQQVIGSITLEKGQGAHSCKAELGYVIARRFWGKGFGSQAIKLAIQTAFTDLGLERIEAYVDPTNIASQKVLEKNGFMREGLLRRCVIQKKVVKDRMIYACLKPVID